MLTFLVFFLLTFLTTLGLYVKRKYSYWERRGVLQLPPTFPFGTMENPFRRKYPLGLHFKEVYNQVRARGAKYGGLYNFLAPVLLAADPEIFKHIMLKDFSYFVDRGVYYNERDDPLSAHIFALGGAKWRRLRVKLSPTFTSGKMKMMFNVLVRCAENMLQALDQQDLEGCHVKDMVARLTTDIIGSCAFGLECNSFEHPDAEFRWHGKNIFKSAGKLKAVAHIAAHAFPELALFFGYKLLPTESTDFFLRVIGDTIRYREANKVSRNDMLQIMAELMKDEDGEKGLTVEEVAAQALIFFLGGFETSSSTMTFCLYELSTHLEMQDRVRKEIEDVAKKHDGKVTYDSITEMTYLGQVVDETLRKYPPGTIVTREAVEDYTLPGTSTVIEKGTMVMLPIIGLHYDPEYFPDPDKFDPERFSEENRGQIQSFTYLPFGEGPRICLGMRFGMMQTKLGLISLLRNYKITLNKKTKLPLRMDPFALVILSTADPIYLDFEKIQK